MGKVHTVFSHTCRRTGGLLALLSVLVVTDLWAAEDPVLRVAISPFAPFVLDPSPETAHGFSIDLWEAMAEDLAVEFRFVPCRGVQDKLDRLVSGEVDVAIGGITVTEERERVVDFTHPCHETGLGILTHGRRTAPSLRLLFSRLFTRNKLGILVGFLGLIVVAGHLMWLAERGRDMFNDHYFPGVFEGMYWAIVTASTVGYGDKAPVRWTGRFLAGLVIIVALPLFALFTAELASTFTLHEIDSRIRGPNDLVGRSVGVVRGTTSVRAGVEAGARVIQYETATEAYAALHERLVEAVVYDVPSLRYQSQQPGNERLAVVGAAFRPQQLAIAVAEDSPLREKLNRALLRLEENGRLSEIRTHWFGQ